MSRKIYISLCVPHNMYETSIRVKKSTVERLKRIGRKGETYDEIINRLLDKVEG